MKPKVRELSVDFVEKDVEGKHKGFDFYVESTENPTKLKVWVKNELKQYNVEFVDIRVSRPMEEFTKPVKRSTISNYIKKFRG